MPALPRRPLRIHVPRRRKSTALPEVATQSWQVQASKSPANALAAHKLRELSQEENMRLRRKHLAPSLRAHYADSRSGPLKLSTGNCFAANLRLHRATAPRPPAHCKHQNHDAVISGAGQYLYDEDRRQYLDCVNNVCHVGHTHPRVVQAAAAQLSILNTNSRYLHDNIVRLAQTLADKMPDPLQVQPYLLIGQSHPVPRLLSWHPPPTSR